jgi:hypothetical protein
MAKQRRPRPITIDDQWDCDLLASPNRVRKNDQLTLTVTLSNPGFDGLGNDDKQMVYTEGFTYDFASNSQLKDASKRVTPTYTPGGTEFSFPVPGIPDGDYDIDVTVTPDEEFWSSSPPAGLVPPDNPIGNGTTISVITGLIETETKVTLRRTFVGPTDDRALWPAIRNRTAAIGFDRYKKFIDCVFCVNPPLDPFTDARTKILSYLDNCPDEPAKPLSIYGPYAYGVLKLATQIFLTLESGVVIRDNTDGKPKIFDIEKERTRVNDFSLTVENLKHELQAYLAPADQLPYLDRIIKNLITLDAQNPDEVLPYCLGVLQFRLTAPSLIELIWSYWLEEGMLVQLVGVSGTGVVHRTIH